MLDVINPHHLYYHPEAVIYNFEARVSRDQSAICSLVFWTNSTNTPSPDNPPLQIWRLVTNFVFFGSFSINWIFHMFFLVNYSRMLEDGIFRGRGADMLYMMLLSATLLLVRQELCPSARLSAQPHGNFPLFLFSQF